MKMHFSSRRARRSGFVLLEVIMALGMFTLVAFSLVLALDTSLDASKERNRIDSAMRGCQNQLAQLRSTRLSPMEKDLPDDGSGISYNLKIAPEPLLDQKKQPLYGIYRIALTATWHDAGSTQQKVVTTLGYSP